MSLYIADEHGFLADVGSASRYEKFLDWAEQQNDPVVKQFADEGSTTEVNALAKALMSAKGKPGSLISILASASLVAQGVITIQDSEEEIEVVALAKPLPKAEIKDWKFDAANEGAANWAADYAGALIEGISKTTRENIADLVEEAMNGEYDTDALASEIAGLLGDDTRAEVIARTETVRAANKGQQEAWSQATEAGLLTGKEKQVWITAPDEKLCPICEELDGTTAPLDGMFEGSEDDYESPPAHPNCRCSVGLQP